MFLLLCITAAAGSASGTDLPVTVKAGIDKTAISIGDRVKYNIEAKSDRDIDIKFPDFGENLAEFAIKDFGSSEGGLFGNKTLTRWYILDTHETGTFTIPGAAVQFREKGSKEWKEAVTGEIKVEVRSVLGEDADKAVIRDIKGPVSLYNWKYIFIALAVLAALAVIVLIIIYMRKRIKSKELTVPPRPAHEIAYEALKELRNKNYLNTGKLQDYYFELSNIVRHYVENRFHLKAPEMTTEEFLGTLKHSAVLTAGQKSTMKDFLSHCDMVKFARHHPDENEIASSYESAEKLIDETKEAYITGAGK